MENKTIYYFSGAGNSLAVAKQLADELGAHLLPIKVLREQNDQAADGIRRNYEPRPADIDTVISPMVESVIGIVFPVHSGRPPKFVIEALSKRVGEGRMQYLWSEGRKKTSAVAQFLTERRSGVIESQSAYGPMLKKENLIMVPSIFKMLGNMIRYGAKDLTQIADENCIGCGTCSSICPADNIRMQDEHPVWLDHCGSCFGCYHWCPKGAISFGGHDMDTVQFHHPDVTVGEMIGYI